MASQSPQRYATVRSFAALSSGFITTEELKRLEVPASTASRWMAGGLLHRLRRGVYRTSAEPFGFEQVVDVASKVMSGRQAIGGRSALSLWKMPGGSKGRLELVGPPGSAFVFAYVTTAEHRDLTASDLTRIGGVRVTTPVRSIIDASVACSPSQIGAQLSDGVRRRLFSYAEVTARLALAPKSGKEGIAKLRAVLRTRIEGERDLNDYERAAARLFKNALIPTPVAQYELVLGHRTFFVDFAWPAERLLVECDSMLAHSTPEQPQHDLSRQNELVAAGWRVVRFTYWDVMERPDALSKPCASILTNTDSKNCRSAGTSPVSV